MKSFRTKLIGTVPVRGTRTLIAEDGFPEQTDWKVVGQLGVEAAAPAARPSRGWRGRSSARTCERGTRGPSSPCARAATRGARGGDVVVLLGRDGVEVHLDRADGPRSVCGMDDDRLPGGVGVASRPAVRVISSGLGAVSAPEMSPSADPPVPIRDVLAPSRSSWRSPP